MSDFEWNPEKDITIDDNQLLLSVNTDTPHNSNNDNNNYRNNNIGLYHWLKTRKEWTKNHKLYSKEKKLVIEDVALRNLSTHSMDLIYENLSNGKKFSTPKPLYFVLDILIYAWKRDGFWDPPKEPYNQRSVPE